jgi:hypothetical protein
MSVFFEFIDDRLSISRLKVTIGQLRFNNNQSIKSLSTGAKGCKRTDFKLRLFRFTDTSSRK